LTPWPAREFHRSTEFIELAGKINQRMPYHCAERVEQAVNDIAKPIKGSKILILGASYKGGVGDIRESPALRIIEVPQSRGGIVSYHDDYVPSLSKFGLESVPLDEAVAEADAVVLVTAHPEVDQAAVAARSALIHRLARGHPRRARRKPRSSLAGAPTDRSEACEAGAAAPAKPYARWSARAQLPAVTPAVFAGAVGWMGVRVYPGGRARDRRDTRRSAL
jgi:hypothetical protein